MNSLSILNNQITKGKKNQLNSFDLFVWKDETNIFNQEISQKYQPDLYNNNLFHLNSHQQQNLTPFYHSYEQDQYNHHTDKQEQNHKYLFGHSEKVAELSYLLGKALNLSKQTLKDLKLTAIYHDIGKTKIPSSILNKPHSLNIDEWAIMKEHPIIGYNIIKNKMKLHNVAFYVKHHHEKIDGSGYPSGLRGDKIPYISRIIAIVDAYDAMTVDRPYRKALSKEQAIKELKDNAGTQFDQHIVEVFINKVL